MLNIMVFIQFHDPSHGPCQSEIDDCRQARRLVKTCGAFCIISHKGLRGLAKSAMVAKSAMSDLTREVA